MSTKFRDTTNVAWGISTTTDMQGHEDNMEDPSEQGLLQKVQAMDRSAGPKSADAQDLGFIDLSGTSQHLKELHSVLQKLAGIRNFTPLWANQYFREIKRKVKAPESLHMTPELNNCKLILDELMHPQHRTYNHWFLQPVDAVVQNQPTYHETILHPMDLGTMRLKLESGDYQAASEFKEDFDLLISNCKIFNWKGETCHTAGEELERMFDRMWFGMGFQP